jgi:Family of unknown function (DUF6758)
MTVTLTGQELPDLLRNAVVPIWLPWPLPAGWLVTGFAGAHEERCAANRCAANRCAANGCAANGCAANGCAANGCAANRCAANGCAANGCAVALSGPNPFGGPGEMLIISEEPGLGLGARFAGLSGLDPGSDFAACPPHAFVRFSNHEFPLWHVDAPHRAAYAGAVLGHWLWLVMFPDTTGLLLAEPLTLRDLRDPGQNLDLPYGERSPLLPD